jgi:small subunit ribosomal protein S4
MGDPRKIRKIYARPRMLWNEALLASDKEIKREYSPKNKKEIWKMNAFLDNIKDQAKNITSRLGTSQKEQAMREQEQLIAKVKRYGLIKKEEVTLSDLLNLTLRDVMDRRLQTLVAKRRLARTVSQARQFIVHGHIKVGGKKITSPSYMVPAADEESIDFVARSPMTKADHPERGDVDPQIIIKKREEAVAEAKAAEEAAKAKEAEAAAEKEASEEAPAEEASEEQAETPSETEKSE